MSYRSTALMLRDIAREEGTPWPADPETIGYPSIVACEVCGHEFPTGITWISDSGNLCCAECLPRTGAHIEIVED